MEEGCKKYPGWQDEQLENVDSVHTAQAGSQGSHLLDTVFSQYPLLGQEPEHIVEDGCKKYPGLQDEQVLDVASEHTAQAGSQGSQV